MKTKGKVKRIKDKIGSKITKIPKLGNIYFSRYTEEGIRFKHMLIHKNIKGYPKIEGFIHKDIIPTKQDMLLTERLLKAYELALVDGKNEENNNSDMWTFLKNGPHADFFKLIKTEDTKALAFYLCNMSRMGLTHGITQGAMEYERIISDSIYRQFLALSTLDKLITLSEAVGAMPLEDPEQGEFGSAIFLNPAEIMKKTENFLKIRISPPAIEGGLYKLPVNNGAIHIRDLTSVYTAWRCREILKNTRDSFICEIGAGVGKTAYYCRLFGINRYTIIDLPHINILQGYYLIKSLPSVNISLYGEEAGRSDSILILPNWSLKRVRGKPYDLILNQDSFPEIDKRMVLNYLSQIQLHTKKFFLSINQESQNTMMVGNLKQHIVFDLMSQIKGYKRIYRFPYWMREGYVEELYGLKISRVDKSTQYV